MGYYNPARTLRVNYPITDNSLTTSAMQLQLFPQVSIYLFIYFIV